MCVCVCATSEFTLIEASGSHTGGKLEVENSIRLDIFHQCPSSGLRLHSFQAHSFLHASETPEDKGVFASLQQKKRREKRGRNGVKALDVLSKLLCLLVVARVTQPSVIYCPTVTTVAQ